MASDTERPRTTERRLDLAARAAWLYYIAGHGQEAIAAKLNVSRQAAQRLVSLAVAEKLITFRLDHPIAACAELAERLSERHGLLYCDVVPSDPDAPDAPVPAGVAAAAARYIETVLARREPTILALSTGRTLRAAVGAVAPLACPRHRIVSLVGTLARDGRASRFEAVNRLADRTGAQCFPMPTPVVAESVEERRLLQTGRSFATLRALAAGARAVLVGIGDVGPGSPMHKDGFITDDEVAELAAHGAVGEVAGWAFDADGRLVEGATNDRVAGIVPDRADRRPVIAVGGGGAKVRAIRAALAGRLISGLITDERTAAAVLA